MKALGSHIEGWKHQMNDAGAQAAAVLALVQNDGSEIRYLRWTCVLCTPSGLAQRQQLSLVVLNVCSLYPITSELSGFTR